MIRTGLPLLEALNIISSSSDNKSLKNVYKEVAIGISKGTTLLENLALYPNIFDEMYLALVSAGEAAGKLPEVLDRESKLLESLPKSRSDQKRNGLPHWNLCNHIRGCHHHAGLCDASFCRNVFKVGS